MNTKVDFKCTLLCSYWLMAGADGSVSTNEDDPEWSVLQKMKVIEGISDQEIEEFLNGDKSEDKLLERLLFNLVVVSHRERLRALAWMDLVMFADGYLHDNEARLFNLVCKRFEIDTEEVLDVKEILLKSINRISQ
jgi:uncharacterized tellurite resistance protein B-like protein